MLQFLLKAKSECVQSEGGLCTAGVCNKYVTEVTCPAVDFITFASP